MRKLLDKIKELKKSQVKETVDRRMIEFEQIGKDKEKVFQELCFCLLTANFSAQRCIVIQEKLGDKFSKLDENKLARELKKLGHRFPNARAGFISRAKNCKIDFGKFYNSSELRNWLVDSVKGIGMKEASHFLRNIGYKNLAIIDFHIVDLLVREELVERPKTMTREKYLKIEDVLWDLARKSGLSLAELDLYLWYMETGKVLK